MNNNESTSANPPWHRPYSLAAGLFYILSFVSIPTLSLYGAIHGPNFIVGMGPDRPVVIGAVLEIIVALAGIGSAAALYPVLKKQNQGMALGVVGTRTVEGALIFVGVACLLTIVTLRQAGVGGSALIVGQALVAMYDRVFLVSQSFIPGVNGVLLGLLFYRSRLVPRVLPVVAFVGAFLLICGDVAVLFGLIEQHAPSTAMLAIPIALWEFSLGVWLVAKGFNPAAVAALETRR